MGRLVAFMGHRWFGAFRDAVFVFVTTAAVFTALGYPAWEIPALAAINMGLVFTWGMAADLYDISHPRVAMPPVQRIFRTLLWVLLSYLTAYFLTDGDPERRTIAYAWAAAIVAFVAGYAARAFILQWFQRRGSLRERLLIVGGDEQALTVVEQIARERRLALQLVGALDEFSPRASRLGPVEVLGDPLELDAAVDRTRATAVVVVANAISWEAQDHVMRVAADRPGLRVFMVAAVSDLLSSEVLSARDGLPPLVRLRPAQLRRSDAFIKRAIELSVAVLMLPAMLVVLGVAQLSGGPPLTRSVEVLGRGGRVVRMRLLEPGRPGSLRARLAEGRAGKLPALPAVLLGRLSLVGPRPWPASMARVDRDPWHRRLLLMAPGLTGPWDLEHSSADSVLDDLTYIRTYTPWSDVKLLVASAGRVIQRRSPVPAIRDLGYVPPEGAIERSGHR